MFHIYCNLTLSYESCRKLHCEKENAFWNYYYANLLRAKIEITKFPVPKILVKLLWHNEFLLLLKILLEIK